MEVFQPCAEDMYFDQSVTYPATIPVCEIVDAVMWYETDASMIHVLKPVTACIV